MIGVTLMFFILMSPKINIRLVLFLAISIISLVVFILILVYWVFAVWAIIGLGQSLLYSLGAAVHLIKGKRTVKEVMEPH